MFPNIIRRSFTTAQGKIMIYSKHWIFRAFDDKNQGMMKSRSQD